MPTPSFDTLDGIYRMMTPGSAFAAQKIHLGNSEYRDDLTQQLLDIVYGKSGANTVDQLSEKFTALSSKSMDAELKKLYKKLINFYKTGQRCEAFGEAPFLAHVSNGTSVTPVDFAIIIGKKTHDELVSKKKGMGVLMCNTGFLSPAVRNASDVELFMNFVPTLVMARCVPMLDVEFEFKRKLDKNDSVPSKWSTGLLRFLMGGGDVSKDEVATNIMLSAREKHDKDNNMLFSTAGMEIFTSPQTLVNPSPVANANRYVDVLDPMRPFLTIESLTVNVQSTVGLDSYKSASLVFKLHDKSRLVEIADLVRPQVYSNVTSAPTVWVMYGWRHPDEPNNPYADFINSKMLVREAFGVSNSSYAFDASGQVTVTLQLWTKGLPELRTLKINDSSSLKEMNRLHELAVKINDLCESLGISDQMSKDIRGYTLLESAMRGSFPDMAFDELKKAQKQLEASLNALHGSTDSATVQNLINAIKEYAAESKTTPKQLDIKVRIDAEATTKTSELFKEVMAGPDPFLPLPEKMKDGGRELSPHHVAIVKSLNAYSSETNVKNIKSPITNKPRFLKKASSFGKLVSVFASDVFNRIEGIDEFQIYFYQFNDKAGSCANASIAEFPIEMPVFLDQYRQHVERKGSERLTLEEFMAIAKSYQLEDPRAIAYGLRKHFNPYDPKESTASRAKSSKDDEYERAISQFTMPAISTYVETLHAEPSGKLVDRLHQYESANIGSLSKYVKVMRMHIFDKANNPYKLPSMLVKSGDDFVEVDDAELKKYAENLGPNNKEIITQGVVKRVSKGDRISFKRGAGVSNEAIKQYVSRMVPSIIYGANSSNVHSANLASKQDSLLATSMMQSMSRGLGKPQTLQANGSDVGGMPLRIVPASMTMNSAGCPLLTYGQLFFVDFNTGTTADNIYNLTGLSHTITPGKFDSQLTLTFGDAYGKFFGARDIAKYAEFVANVLVESSKKK